MPLRRSAEHHDGSKKKMPNEAFFEQDSRFTNRFLARGAHCTRVAGLAVEIGRALGINRSLLVTLRTAAWLHDDLSCLTRSGSQRLIEDLQRSECTGETADLPILTPEVLQVLRALHQISGPEHEEPVERLAAIIRLANKFDEAFEWLQFESMPVAEVLEDLALTPELGAWTENVFGAFLQLSAGHLELAIANANRLPISAISAVRKLATAPIEDLTVDGLAEIALSDPTITAGVLRAANSAQFATRTPISNVQHAILFGARDNLPGSAFENLPRQLESDLRARMVDQFCGWSEASTW